MQFVRIIKLNVYFILLFPFSDGARDPWAVQDDHLWQDPGHRVRGEFGLSVCTCSDIPILILPETRSQSSSFWYWWFQELLWSRGIATWVMRFIQSKEKECRRAIGSVRSPCDDIWCLRWRRRRGNKSKEWIWDTDSFKELIDLLNYVYSW